MNRYSVTIQGWGNNDEKLKVGKLTQIDLTIRKNYYCDEKYRKLSASQISYSFPNLTIPEMFCADGNLNPTIGTCYGDSGGPALIRYDSFSLNSNICNFLEMTMEILTF